MKPSAVAVLRLLQLRGERGATSLDGFRLAGTSRMAARVAELRAAGHRIESITETTGRGAWVARYRLVKE